jgi:hypothetical protein
MTEGRAGPFTAVRHVRIYIDSREPADKRARDCGQLRALLHCGASGGT